MSLAGSAGAVAVGPGTVNVDLEDPAGAATQHVGDDGILSNPGGTVWNSVLTGTDTSNLVDEFGGATGVNIRFEDSFAQTFTDTGINDLQDSGASTGIELHGLAQNQSYDLAVYVGENGGFNFEHAGGPTSYFFADPGADGWSLPGSESIPNGAGGDYYLITGVMPVDLGGGDFGFGFGLDGTVTAMQIVIPEPSTLLLFGLGIVGLTAVGGRRTVA
jgi:hypothetical protein